MIEQLSLGIDPPEDDNRIAASILSASEMRGYHISELQRREGMEPYNPRLCKARLLEAIGFDDWTGFCGLAGTVRQPIHAVSHMLDLLVLWGRLERTKLYYVAPGHDRHKRPEDKAYRGFEWGYRQIQEKEDTRE